MATNQDFDFKAFQEESIKGLYSGNPSQESIVFCTYAQTLFRTIFTRREVDERSLGKSNRRNGVSSKRVKSNVGEFELQKPRDRSVSFEPSIVPKRQVVLTEQLEGQIISMYSRGMTGPPVRLFRNRQIPARNIWIFFVFQ